MLPKSFLVAVLVLALVSIACGVNINVPVTDLKTGPTVTDDIRVENLSNPDAVANVSLEFGAGELNISPGAENALISGTATYNVADFKPEVSANGENIKVATGNLVIRGIPKFDRDKYKNIWDLSLGVAPMDLSISAGAYKGLIELGGLSLHSLKVGDGASEVALSFSQQNLAEMNTFRYETGASKVTLTDLANANFDQMIFKGGAGEYELDFSGELKRDADVEIEAGVCDLTIIVPEGANVRVEIGGGLTNIDTRGNWDQSGKVYTLSGSGPAINIHITMGAGDLNLETR